jgi:hypothetical protein
MLSGDKDFLPGVLESEFFATEPAALPVASAFVREWFPRKHPL